MASVVLSILPDDRLAVTFHEAATGVVTLSAATLGSEVGIYEPLKDPPYFAQARIELGTITWTNGADLDPAWMHDQIRQSNTWSVLCSSPSSPAVYPRARHLSQRVRAFVDFLVERFAGVPYWDRCLEEERPPLGSRR